MRPTDEVAIKKARAVRNALNVVPNYGNPMDIGAQAIALGATLASTTLGAKKKKAGLVPQVDPMALPNSLPNWGDAFRKGGGTVPPQAGGEALLNALRQRSAVRGKAETLEYNHPYLDRLKKAGPTDNPLMAMLTPAPGERGSIEQLKTGAPTLADDLRLRSTIRARQPDQVASEPFPSPNRVSRLSAPGTSAGGTPIAPADTPPTNNPTAPNPEDLRRDIELRRLRTALASKQGRMVQTRSTGLSEQEGDYRAGTIADLGNRVADIDTALAPVQRELSNEEIAGGQANLRAQGIQQAKLKMKMALDRAKLATTPAEKAALEDEYRTASRAAAEFESSPQWAPLGPEQVQQRQRDQLALRQVQEARKQGAMTEATGDLSRNQEAKAMMRDIEKKSGQVVASQLDAQIAENSPEAVKLRQQIMNSELQARLRQTRSGGALAGQQAAMEQFGITNQFRETAARGIASLNNAMSGYEGGFVSGGTFGGAENLVRTSSGVLRQVAKLEQMAQVDPQAAQDIAAELLGQMPLPNESGQYTSGTFGGTSSIVSWTPQNVRNRRILTSNMNSLYQRLNRLANPRPSQEPNAG